jgi:hypothetical protein
MRGAKYALMMLAFLKGELPPNSAGLRLNNPTPIRARVIGLDGSSSMRSTWSFAEHHLHYAAHELQRIGEVWFALFGVRIAGA